MNGWSEFKSAGCPLPPPSSLSAPSKQIARGVPSRDEEGLSGVRVRCHPPF